MGMKSFTELRQLAREGYDPYRFFQYKKNAAEPDDKYGFRSIVVYRQKYRHSTGEMRDQQVAAMFPPFHLRTTDNRYEFLRQLDAFVKDLEKQGAEIIAVHPKGHPEYQKYVGSATKGYNWKNAR